MVSIHQIGRTKETYGSPFSTCQVKVMEPPEVTAWLGWLTVIAETKGATRAARMLNLRYQVQKAIS